MANRLFVGQCELDLHIANCQSLKEKRRVVKSIKERLKNKYNVSVCEYGDLSLWQRAQLGIVTCGNDKKLIDSTINTVIQFVDGTQSVSLIDYKINII